ncbi:hypothetical protein RF11_02667 [Thelohanellus kitauei]|uniref:Reverse transcriptase domain-containing protein n=1 Tax=Thelohanellus kitauei TaxID=669202 RepID=A0A0C2JHS8_THEKT|nr:hypothetical protein RF11_02667 [Thelohanellus kitauei]
MAQLQIITVDKVVRKLSTLKRISAAGPDEIFYNPWILLFDSENTTPPLDLLNRIICERTVMDCLKLAKTILLPKTETANPTNIDYFRPISISNTLYRILTGLLAARIQRESRSIFKKSQRSFRRCDRCLLNTGDLIQTKSGKNKKTL